MALIEHASFEDQTSVAAVRLGLIYGFTVLRSRHDAAWAVFDVQTANLRGWIRDTGLADSDEDTLIHVRNRLREMAGEDGALYALRAEAFAVRGKQA